MCQKRDKKTLVVWVLLFCFLVQWGSASEKKKCFFQPWQGFYSPGHGGDAYI